MKLSELAYRQGATFALQKFAAGIGALSMPSAPKPMAPPSSIAVNKPPPAIGGSQAAPTAPAGMPAASGVSATPGMAMQTSPVLGTGEKPAANSASVAGQTALQGAAKSVTTHGGGK